MILLGRDLRVFEDLGNQFPIPPGPGCRSTAKPAGFMRTWHRSAPAPDRRSAPAEPLYARRRRLGLTAPGLAGPNHSGQNSPTTLSRLRAVAAARYSITAPAWPFITLSTGRAATAPATTRHPTPAPAATANWTRWRIAAANRTSSVVVSAHRSGRRWTLSPTSPAVIAAPAAATTTGVALAAASPASPRPPLSSSHLSNSTVPHHAQPNVNPVSAIHPSHADRPVRRATHRAGPQTHIPAPTQTAAAPNQIMRPWSASSDANDPDTPTNTATSPHEPFRVFRRL